jgi:integrase
MHAAGETPDGFRLLGLVVVLWRAGLRISEALSLTESDLDAARGAILVRRGPRGLGTACAVAPNTSTTAGGRPVLCSARTDQDARAQQPVCAPRKARTDDAASAGLAL